MRNPQSKFQISFWTTRAIARIRRSLGGRRFFGGQRGALSAWMAVVLLCAMLVGGVSLVKLGRRTSTNSEKKVASAATPKVTAAQRAPEQKQVMAPKSESASARKPKARPQAKGQSAKTAQVAEVQSAVLAKPVTAPVLAPPISPAQAGENEKENSDISKERASWFHDQRAYPNKHIPAGALQKAIEQRDLMRAQQRAAFKPGAGANAIISFPGDALWHSMGPQPITIPFTGLNAGFPTASGRVTAIAVDPTNANIVYIGGAAGGVWKTTDGGTTWAALTDSQPSLAVGSIAIDPNSCSPAPCTTIYVGTGEDNFNIDAFYGAGILRSKDGGNTWTQLGKVDFVGPISNLSGGAQIGAIAVQPGNSNVILASVFFFDGNDANGGVWRSTDGGTTWVRPTTGAQGSAGTGVFFESTVVPPATVPVAWAALGDIFPGAGSSNGIWRSTDAGVTWTKQAGGLPASNVGRITLGYAASTAGATANVYAVIGDASTPASRDLLGIFKTVNGGTAWTAVTGPAVTGGFCAHQCFYDMAIGVSPTNPSVVVLGGGAGPNNFTSLFESTNSGGAWTPATAAAGDFSFGSTSTHPHVDTHAIVFSANAATLFVGNDGGIWSTSTPTPASGVSPTWLDLNAGLAITQFYPGPTAAVSDENYGFGGTQDNDTELFQG
ncbi:MAG TPA: hypothetical protein VE263_15555, partial [Candidatus Angelobacter sp.]|nr:hypothetical protein [Candidatus Angelobacter sp.]